jgi:hypothetical protein
MSDLPDPAWALRRAGNACGLGTPDGVTLSEAPEFRRKGDNSKPGKGVPIQVAFPAAQVYMAIIVPLPSCKPPIRLHPPSDHTYTISTSYLNMADTPLAYAGSLYEPLIDERE